ncbi:thioesterase II family protein [Paenibacillus tundrae]|uniref:thioesterase II family protein n=1 Tax=Paenibacillus tundrae TaxID=528187 RepID=UPI0022A90067|nr:thioesterase domain-containing protein [Paenibacillus tundrae]MCZ1264750.1 thioesterase [Paenibacillus tundrae]
MRKCSIDLICFPHAGGSSSSFNYWKKLIPNWISIQTVELPGRGTKIREPLFHNFDNAHSYILSALGSVIRPDVPFAFFGHSLGALMALEAAKRMEKVYGREPIHLFLSGCLPPHQIRTQTKISLLPDDLFITKLTSFGGLPRQILEQKELIQFFLAIIRADFEVYDSYHAPVLVPLEIDTTILSGRHDLCTGPYNVAEWLNYFSKGWCSHEFSGDHFFTVQEAGKVIELIENTLAKALL